MFFIINILLVYISGAILYSYKIGTNRAITKDFWGGNTDIKTSDSMEYFLLSIYNSVKSGKKMTLSFIYSTIYLVYLYWIFTAEENNAISDIWIILPMIVLSTLWILYLLLFKGHFSTLKKQYKEKVIAYIILIPCFSILLIMYVYGINNLGLFYSFEEFYSQLYTLNIEYIYLLLLLVSIVFAMCFSLILYISIGFFRQYKLERDYWFSTKNILICFNISMFMGIGIYFLFSSNLLSESERFASQGFTRMIFIILSVILVPLMMSKLKIKRGS